MIDRHPGDMDPVDFLRQAGRCPRSHVLQFSTRTSPSDPLDSACAFILHNGREIVIRVDALAYRPWGDILAEWAIRASDLHREEVMQSDWPVF